MRLFDPKPEQASLSYLELALRAATTEAERQLIRARIREIAVREPQRPETR